MSMKKTKNMAINGITTEIKVENGKIEKAHNFPYLGSIIDGDGSTTSDIKNRKSKAWTAFSKLWPKVWGIKQISNKTKMDIYNACVLSVLLYGAEAWSLRKPQLVELERFHMSCLRCIFGISRREQHIKRLSNKVIIEETVIITTIEEMLRKKMLRWIGHVARMDNNRLAKQLMFSWVNRGERQRKMQSGRFRDRMAYALRSRSINLNHWVSIAQNRDARRAIVANKQKNKTRARAETPPYEGALRCKFPGCGQWWNGKTRIAKHTSLKHTEGTEKAEPFRCDKCTYTAMNKASLTRHKKDVHRRGVTPVVCRICGAHYKTQEGCDKHIERAHD